MKRNTLVLLIFTALISCKKDQVKVIPVRESLAFEQSSPQIFIPILESNIVSAEYITRYTQRVRYSNNAVALITQNSTDTTKYTISLTANFKTSNFNASVNWVNSVRSVKFYSGDIIYFSFLANNLNQVGNMYFNELNYPYQTTYPLSRLTYIGCMQKMIKSCGASWTCSTICGFGIISCSLGWSLTCTALVINH